MGEGLGGPDGAERDEGSLMLCRLRGSSETSLVSSLDCEAKAAKKVLKLGIRPESACSWTFSAAVTFPIEAISCERSV